MYRLSDGVGLVFTVDFFTPIVDDPGDFGRIAAANAVSDVYAMGGTPLVAVNVVCFPEGELPPSVLADILIGGQEKMNEAGAIVIGGHSVSDRELKYGLAVTGTIDPGKIVTNAGARPGDVLVITKPIGTGVLTTALKNEALSDELLARVTATMTELNRAPSSAMVEAVPRVPPIEGALDTIRAGFRPAGLLANQQYYRQFVKLTSRADGHTLDLMNDPQTSGGLLIALSEDRLDAFAAALAEAGGGSHWPIGRVLARGEKAVVLS